LAHLAATNGQLRALLARVAQFEPDGVPVVSAYLDLRPGATQNPTVRTGQVVLRDTLRDAIDSLGAHTPERQSIEQDAEQISAQLDELLPDARGAVFFACSSRDLFAWAATSAPLSDDVSVGARARVAPLARLADFEPAIVALVDSKTLRVFGLRSSELTELGLIDDDPEFQRVQAGGWSQARYQRRVDERREAFAELAAEAIEENASAEGASIILIAGDDQSINRLREQLPTTIADNVRATLHADIRATAEDMTELCMPELERIREQDAVDACQRLVGAAEGEGLGVASLEEVRAALGLGQVMELLIADQAPDTGQPAVDDETLEELVRLAVTTDARVRFAGFQEALLERGGVGAFLRFRLDRAINAPADEASDVEATLA
jgi:peptide chain release factor subunit 1